MRTLEDYAQIIEVSCESKSYEVYATVVITYNRHRYKFTSGNWRACKRLGMREHVNNKVLLYGYSLKGAYEAFYKEFTKLRIIQSDRLTAIIC